MAEQLLPEPGFTDDARFESHDQRIHRRIDNTDQRLSSTITNLNTLIDAHRRDVDAINATLEDMDHKRKTATLAGAVVLFVCIVFIVVLLFK